MEKLRARSRTDIADKALPAPLPCETFHAHETGDSWLDQDSGEIQQMCCEFPLATDIVMLLEARNSTSQTPHVAQRVQH